MSKTWLGAVTITQTSSFENLATKPIILSAVFQASNHYYTCQQLLQNAAMKIKNFGIKRMFHLRYRLRFRFQRFNLNGSQHEMERDFSPGLWRNKKLKLNCVLEIDVFLPGFLSLIARCNN